MFRGAGRSPPRLPAMPSIRIEVFHSVSEVEHIWRKAQEQCACYGFQTFEWLSTWQETIGVAERIEPHIVHIADANENTLMLLPLGIQRRLGLLFLSFLGGHVTDYHAPIVRAEFAAGLDAAALNSLMAWALERLPRIDVIAFEKMPSVIDDASNPFAGLADAKHVCNAHAATLGGTFTDFRKRRNAKFFSTAWRRLSKIAPVRFCIAESPDAAAEILRDLIRQKRRRYQELGYPGALADFTFHATVAKRHLITGLIQTSALCVGETMVATHLGMIFRNCFYYLMPSYEAGDWARFSPGRILMQSSHRMEHFTRPKRIRSDHRRRNLQTAMGGSHFATLRVYPRSDRQGQNLPGAPPGRRADKGPDQTSSPRRLASDKAHAETDQTSKSNQTEPFDRSVLMAILDHFV